MRILLFGKDGQIGWELQRSLAPLGELIALNSRHQEFCGNLTQLSGLQQTIRKIKPDIIVNAAAYTAVDQAENEFEKAYIINAEAPGILAQEAKLLNAWFIHYSTDYVFSGKGDRPYCETDETAPLNVYGKTKLAGEKNIESSGCSYLIFRTSWIYATQGNNFIKTILRLAQQRPQLKIINDQIGSPTGADLVADITAHTLFSLRHNPNVSGLYHLAAKGHTSWYEYAKVILAHAQNTALPFEIQTDSILPIASSDFLSPAKRPLNSRLDSTKLEETFGLHLPDWKSGVTKVLTEILATQPIQ